MGNDFTANIFPFNSKASQEQSPAEIAATIVQNSFAQETHLKIRKCIHNLQFEIEGNIKNPDVVRAVVCQGVRRIIKEDFPGHLNTDDLHILLKVGDAIEEAVKKVEGLDLLPLVMVKNIITSVTIEVENIAMDIINRDQSLVKADLTPI